MANRPGRPRGGPGLAQRAAEYRTLRERHLTYDEAAEAMGVSRDAIRWYAKHLREAGDLPPAREPKPAPQPREPRRDLAREAIEAHLSRWPASWFSAWDLHRALGLHDPSVRRVLKQFAAEGLVEVVDGKRYPTDRRVPVRRYRLAADRAEDAHG